MCEKLLERLNHRAKEVTTRDHHPGADPSTMRAQRRTSSVSPAHAEVYNRGGLSKSDLKKLLWEHSAMPARHVDHRRWRRNAFGLCAELRHVINPGLIKKLPYDSLRDFAPISLLNINPQLLIVNPSVPAKNVKELIALAKSRPGMLNYSSSGSGGANHLSGELFKFMARIQILHVPYKGNAPSLTALVSGEVDFAFNSMPSSLPLIKVGRLRPIAVTSSHRSTALPQVPTVAEAGLPGYEAVAWTGLSAPAKTPGELVERINSAVVAIVGASDFQETLKAEGSEAVASSPEQFAAFLKTEIGKWQKIIDVAGVKAD
jgi:tripartite-type tricarboxylate transporter receptor subunit TctC